MLPRLITLSRCRAESANRAPCGRTKPRRPPATAEPVEDRDPEDERADASEAVEFTENDRSSGGQWRLAELGDTDASGDECRVRGGETDCRASPDIVVAAAGIGPDATPAVDVIEVDCVPAAGAAAVAAYMAGIDMVRGTTKLSGKGCWPRSGPSVGHSGSGGIRGRVEGGWRMDDREVCVSVCCGP